LFLLPAGAWATNGMEMIGFGARSAGMGGVSVGIADGAASLIRNPAGIAHIGKAQLDVGIGVMTPSMSFKNPWNDSSSNRDTHSSFYGFYPMPMLAYARRIDALPRMCWGLGLFVPGGLGADYDLAHPLWPEGAPYHSQLIYARGVAAAGYQVTRRLSVGVGLNGGFGWMDLWQPFATSPDFAQGSTAGSPATLIGPTYGSVFQRVGYQEVTCMFTMRQAFAFGIGANVGILYDVTDRIRVGLSYTSPMPMRYRARATMDMTRQFQEAAGRFGISQSLAYRAFGLSQAAGMKDYPDVEYRLDWPQQAGVGVSAYPIQRLLVAVDFRWINWSATMDSYVMDLSSFSNPNFIRMIGANACTRSVPLNWRDQFVIACGAAFEAGRGWTLRAGYNYGRNPVPADTAMPTFPAIVEHHATVGVGKRWKRLEAAAAFEYAFKKNLLTTESIVADFFNESQNELEEFVLHFTLTWRWDKNIRAGKDL